MDCPGVGWAGYQDPDSCVCTAVPVWTRVPVCASLCAVVWHWTCAVAVVHLILTLAPPPKLDSSLPDKPERSAAKREAPPRFITNDWASPATPEHFMTFVLAGKKKSVLPQIILLTSSLSVENVCYSMDPSTHPAASHTCK